MAEIEIAIAKTTWRDFIGEAAWMLLACSAPWGLSLGLNQTAGIVYMLAVWLPMTFVLITYVTAGAKMFRFQIAVEKGIEKARIEYEKGVEITKGVAEIIQEQNRK